MNPDQRKHAEASVLRASRTYGIHTRRDDVQAALNDPQRGPSFAEWALMHLGSDTLLTADELDLYMALDRTGRVDQLADLHDLAEVEAVTEDELRIAIEELKRYTESVSKQTETLRQQHDAVSRMVKKQAENAARRQELERVRRRKNELESSEITKQIARISEEITLRLAELERSGPALNDSISSVLESDDKLLSSLQKLGWELNQPDPAETKTVEKLRETCMRLIKATVETVRTKLDTVYLESLITAERSGIAEPATADEVKELQDEVESLYSEILSVAQMSVDQQHLEPALKAVVAKSGQSMGKTTTSLEYVNGCLTYLLDRIDRLNAHVESHKSHQAATAAITATAKAELAVDVKPARKTRPVIPDSPVRRTSPNRARSNTTNAPSHRRPSDIQDETPLETLFQNLAVPHPPVDARPRDQILFLEKVLAERTRKCNDVAKSAQESFEFTAREQLQDARLAVQLVRDSVLAESPFAEVKLVDPDMEASILVLAQEVDKAKEKLRSLEGQSIVTKSEKKEDLIQRWGS